MSSLLKHARVLAREAPASGFVPIVAHVGEHVARTRSGHYVQAFRVGGAAFESADDADLNGWHERLNAFWRTVASPQLAVWAHVVRRRSHAYPAGAFAPGFAADLDARYRAKIAGAALMVNELYVTLVWRAQASRTQAVAWRALRHAQRGQDAVELADALDACDKLAQQALAALARYDPEPLGLYARAGVLHSSLVELYAFLVNGHWQRVPVARAPLDALVATTRPLFGLEAMEYRMATSTRLAAFIGIKEYPAQTAPGLFNALLTAPFPFVLTQSFAFLPKATALDLMARQRARLAASGDVAASQAEELAVALDDLASNRFVVGDHHFTLQVQTEPFEGVAAAAGAPLRSLNDAVAAAIALLADAGLRPVREDLGLEPGFWAQLPGNFSLRVRKAPITSRNFAALVPLHNYPAGRAAGNHWGAALTMFVTSARSPYFFSLHASDPRAPGGGARRDVGHLAVFGPVGTGKTTLEGFLIAMLGKFGATQLVFDKDEGLHILVRALGGRYRALAFGTPTGCNPLQLDAREPANVEFMKRWLRILVRRGEATLTVREDEDLDAALRGVLALPERAARRLSRLVEFLDPTDPEGLHARLAPWVAGGDDAWVFDHAQDEIAQFLASSMLLGFDVTEFLAHPRIAEPLTAYLLHLAGRLADGRRLVCWMDEFDHLLRRPAFAEFARDGLQTWRKRDAVFAALTQSTSHVLDSPIARAIVEQTPTKIFFPNPDADRHELMEGFSLTEREFRLVKSELEPGARTFLVKQGHASVVATLDLAGFDYELDVISGRTRNVALMKRLIARHGEAPAAWLPAFRAARAAGRHAASTGAAAPPSPETDHVDDDPER